jgi:DNA-binding NarL/FixJ family response regulator
MHVFLVDDSPEIRERLCEMFYAVKGVEIVGEADRANDAINSIIATKPEAVVLDIQLVGHETGIDVLERIKQEKPAPKVIILTNYPYPQYRKRCIQAGADFFFDKSIELDKVTAVLGELAKHDGNDSNDATGAGAKDTEKEFEPTKAVVYTTSVFNSRWGF